MTKINALGDPVLYCKIPMQSYKDDNTIAHLTYLFAEGDVKHSYFVHFADTVLNGSFSVASNNHCVPLFPKTQSRNLLRDSVCIFLAVLCCLKKCRTRVVSGGRYFI